MALLQPEGKMLDRTIIEELGGFLSAGYAKMLLERPYDEFFKTKLGQQLKSLGNWKKNSLVIALGLSAFFLQKKLPDGSTWQQAFKEVATDAWPEFSKRLLNGFSDFLIQRASTADPQETAVIAQLQTLDPETLKDLLSQLHKASQPQITDQIKPKSSATLTRAITGLKAARQKIQAKPKGVLW